MTCTDIDDTEFQLFVYSIYTVFHSYFWPNVIFVPKLKFNQNVFLLFLLYTYLPLLNQI